jgi:hypothetical protein
VRLARPFPAEESQAHADRWFRWQWGIGKHSHPFNGTLLPGRCAACTKAVKEIGIWR